MRLAALALLACSCDRSAPIASCTDDLAGLYDADGRRWAVLDHRRGLEIYPTFDDTPAAPPPGLEIAPRVIDLRRTDDGLLAGEVTRRYLQGALRCDARAAARVTACRGDLLELVLADPVPPLAFEPCTWGQRAPSRRERWRRVK